jgi:hypothetical protein
MARHSPPQARSARSTRRHPLDHRREGELLGQVVCNPPPPPDQQIRFLPNIHRLLAEGLLPATYKHALNGHNQSRQSANLVLLDANPLDDVDNVFRQDGVMLGGGWFLEAELRQNSRGRVPRNGASDSYAATVTRSCSTSPLVCIEGASRKSAFRSSMLPPRSGMKNAAAITHAAFTAKKRPTIFDLDSRFSPTIQIAYHWGTAYTDAMPLGRVVVISES